MTVRSPPYQNLLQTAFFRFGLALKRTVLPALTLTGSPVRGLRALRALVFLTVNMPERRKCKTTIPFQFLHNCIHKISSSLICGHPCAIDRILDDRSNKSFTHGPLTLLGCLPRPAAWIITVHQMPLANKAVISVDILKKPEKNTEKPQLAIKNRKKSSFRSFDVTIYNNHQTYQACIFV